MQLPVDNPVYTMMFIPYRRVDVPTSLTIGEIVELLTENVDIRKSVWPGPWRPKSMYWGRVSLDGFQIVRSTWGRNTYLPLITGRFKPSAEGTVVTVRLTLHPVAMVILAVLVGLAGFLCLRTGGGCVWVLLAALVLFHLGMNLVGFYPEEKQSIDWLSNLLSTTTNRKANDTPLDSRSNSITCPTNPPPP
jgi:hypothetical protein